MAPRSRESRPAPKSTKEKRDDDIMLTNDSSIVSKQSVVKIYHRDQPDFFAPFIAKPLRRSPLINRGYWLRIRAVEHTVTNFLKEPSKKEKVIVNLGCGYDPLPFHFLHQYPELSSRTTFVDVDYPKLMHKKRACISNSAMLQELLPVLASGTSKGDHIWRAGQYVAVGCDLRKLAELEDVLQREVQIHDCAVLFIAEVSIAYMDVKSADAVIAWASSFKDARFCILEQCLPEGPGHPFAKTMLGHFAKLHANLKVVYAYPTVDAQETRFRTAGWTRAKARTLWTLWEDEDFISASQRRDLDSVEPFDEWEEFALIGGHYLLVVARTEDAAQPITDPPHVDTQRVLPHERLDVALQPGPSQTGEATLRRFGAMYSNGDKAVFHGGYGAQSRLKDCDIYSGNATYENTLEPPSVNPGPLMCHTITKISPDDDLFLLAGGRESPSKALVNTWLLTSSGRYIRTDSFKDGYIFGARYRHCAVPVSINNDKATPGVLIYGGKSDARTVLGDFVLFDLKKQSWFHVPCSVSGQSSTVPSPRFGASMCKFEGQQEGILLGGISENGTILEDMWRWTLEWKNDNPQITCVEVRIKSAQDGLPISRFGAQLLHHSERSFLLVGGVTKDRIVPWNEEIILADFDRSLFVPVQMPACPDPRPLFIGIGAARLQDEIVLAGGGAVCFSMGCFWNMQGYSLQVKDGQEAPQPSLEGLPDPANGHREAMTD